MSSLEVIRIIGHHASSVKDQGEPETGPVHELDEIDRDVARAMRNVILSGLRSRQR
jgi:hypothetical protein